MFRKHPKGLLTIDRHVDSNWKRFVSESVTDEEHFARVIVHEEYFDGRRYTVVADCHGECSGGA